MGRKQITDDVVNLNYVDMGQGIPIVFIHGFPLDHSTWLPTAKILVNEAFCILPDMRGLGNSPFTGTETSILQMAKDVIHLLDGLEIPKAVFVGHSMGGYVALHLAHFFEERTLGMGLVATRSKADEPQKAEARLRSRELVLREGMSTLVEEMAARLTDDLDLLPGLRVVMSRANPNGTAMVQYAMAHRPDASKWLRKIKVPVAVIAGERDGIIRVSELMDLASRLPNGKFFSSTTATHMIPMEEPAFIARVLKDTFIQE